MTPELFKSVVNALRDAGYADDDIEWSENAGPPKNAVAFAIEAIFVICNSGMKNTVARGIFERVRAALVNGRSAGAVFGHKGKVGAIDLIWATRQDLFTKYIGAADKVEYCASLPWIGPITKYHLAKNFGVDVAKPDIHLVRLADFFQTTPQALCDSLAETSGYKARTVDLLLWRAAANGILDTRTGVILGTGMFNRERRG